MSCSDKIKCERLKVFSHASVLACQEANLTNTKIAVVKLTHHHYGDYYDGIEYEKAKDQGLKIYLTYIKGNKAKKVPKSVKAPILE